MTDAIRIVGQTADTVTIHRSDFEALVLAAEDAEDLAALTAHDAEEAGLGRDAARRDYLTADEATRLLDGKTRSEYGGPSEVFRNGLWPGQPVCSQATWLKSRPDESGAAPMRCIGSRQCSESR